MNPNTNPRCQSRLLPLHQEVGFRHRCLFPRQRYRTPIKQKSANLFLLIALTIGIMSGTVTAQPSSAPSPTNSQWCSDIPASPAPPKFDNWSRVRADCIKGGGRAVDCADACVAARELWKAQREGRLSQAPPMTSREQPQGPFPMPGGGSGYILPLPPTPNSVATPSALQSSPLAPLGPTSAGPFSNSKFPGQELNAAGDGEPPDVSADVSPTQNVEFVNGKGIYVWNKPVFPIPSPAPTPVKIIDPGLPTSESLAGGATKRLRLDVRRTPCEEPTRVFIFGLGNRGSRL
jgi:hypothetical protein